MFFVGDIVKETVQKYVNVLIFYLIYENYEDFKTLITTDILLLLRHAATTAEETNVLRIKNTHLFSEAYKNKMSIMSYFHRKVANENFR